MRQHLSLSDAANPPPPSRSPRRRRVVVALSAGATVAAAAFSTAAATTPSRPARSPRPGIGVSTGRASTGAVSTGAVSTGAPSGAIVGVPGWPASATTSRAALAVDAESRRYRLSVEGLLAAERAQLDVLWRSRHAGPQGRQTRVPASWTDSALHLSLSVLDAPLSPGGLRGHLARAGHEARGAHGPHAAHPPRTPGSSAYANGGVAPSSWLELRICESGDNYAADTGNGYYGAYQFLATTWWALGYGGMPSSAPPAVQDAAARRLLAVQGWSAWPQCSARLGL